MLSAHTQPTFGGHTMDRYLFDYEAVADAPPVSEAPAPVADESVAAPPEPDTTGAAEVAATPAEPPAPTIDWNSPEARQAFEQFQTEREVQAAEQARQAEQAQRQASEFDDIREAFALLGVDGDRFDAYLNSKLGTTVAPFAEAAQQFQTEQSMRQITAQLEQIGATHPDLLGDGIGKLAEYTGEDGQPLFNPDRVREQNQSAVISATVGILEASKDAAGNPTVPWTVAAEHAAKAVADRDTVMKKIGVEEFKRQLAGTSNAAVDITNGAAGGAARVTGIEGGDELAVARRFAQEHGLR